MPSSSSHSAICRIVVHGACLVQIQQGTLAMHKLRLTHHFDLGYDTPSRSARSVLTYLIAAFSRTRLIDPTQDAAYGVRSDQRALLSCA